MKNAWECFLDRLFDIDSVLFFLAMTGLVVLSIVYLWVNW